MNKVIRILIFSSAIILFYFTFSTIQNKFASMLLIGFAALLLCSMENVRRKRDDIFKTKSEALKVEGLKKEEFILYIAELFKRLGYFIDPISKDNNKEIHFIMRKGKQVIGVRYDEVEETTLDSLKKLTDNMKRCHVKKMMIISKDYFSQEVQVFSENNNVMLVDKKRLMMFIDQVVDSKETAKKALKAQELT